MADDTTPSALVVDDDPIILMDAASIVEDAGFRCIEAGDVDEALFLLEEHADAIALLFTDVQMPGDRDGFDLANETSRRWPDIKILIASGNLTPEPGKLPDGAVFIRKPFSAEIVQERLIELLPDGHKPEPLKRKAYQ
jgi:CheY-like chemotaxis protein